MPVSALPRPEFAPNLRTPGVRVTIHGADSPEGRELARLLRLHPGIESAREIACDGGLLVGWDATVEPHWRSPSGRYSAADYVFVCLPPERAAPVVAAALEAGARVIDLSRDPSWSLGSPTEEAAYGLPELTPGRVREADHVASAGSLASCATLALGPVAMAGELDEDAEVQIEATVGLARWPRTAGRTGDGGVPVALCHRTVAIGKVLIDPLHPVPSGPRCRLFVRLLPCDLPLGHQ